MAGGRGCQAAHTIISLVASGRHLVLAAHGITIGVGSAPISRPQARCGRSLWSAPLPRYLAEGICAAHWVAERFRRLPGVLFRLPGVVLRRARTRRTELGSRG